jgi:hypothetical protein
LLLIYFQKFRQIWHAKIGRHLFSATTGAIFIPKLALSRSDTGELNVSFRLKIAPVVAENKSRPIWGWSIQPKRTVFLFQKSHF